MVVGIICEYNPLHNGHQKQLQTIRNQFGSDCTVVCLMSGNYVQRGEPAVFRKDFRAKAAILSGADLVLELPATCCLSSAEGFASGGVAILGQFCDYLCFGAEIADCEMLMNTAEALLSPKYTEYLKAFLDTGISFPAARQKALEMMEFPADFISSPNNNLGVEYCKAILQSGMHMKPFPITRAGGYHNITPDYENPSATAVRSQIFTGSEWTKLVPKAAFSIFSEANVHALQYGEKAILARLRTMSDEEFESLPYGSEGLWRKLMHASRNNAALTNIIETTKSKRYTYSRISRMVMCAFLGITQDTIAETPPHIRILAFNEKGRGTLRHIKTLFPLINAGEKIENHYWKLEKRASDLYGLFSQDSLEIPGEEERMRVFYDSGEVSHA